MEFQVSRVLCFKAKHRFYLWRQTFEEHVLRKKELIVNEKKNEKYFVVNVRLRDCYSGATQFFI